MDKTPRNLSQTPHELEFENPRGDVLADVIGTSLLRNAIYKRIECGAPWGMSVPQLDRATFYLVARGTARFEVDREPVHELSTGDALFIPHGTHHIVRDAKTTIPERVCDSPSHRSNGVTRRLGGKGAMTSLVAGFFQFVGRKPALLESMPRVIPLTATDPVQRRWTSATLQLLLDESAAPGPASAIVVQRLADVLLVQMLRTLVRPTSGMAALADPAIHEALSTIHARVAYPWTVEALAKTVGMSRSAFASRFAALVGEPPLQYLARWRVARAAGLLRETQQRISEIAADVGYESVPSFNKAFRKWQGESPSEFRARHA